MVIAFIEHLRIVTTSNHSAVANLHCLQFTSARTKYSQSSVPPAMSSASMFTLLPTGDCFTTHGLLFSMRLTTRMNASDSYCPDPQADGHLTLISFRSSPLNYLKRLLSTQRLLISRSLSECNQFS